MLRRWRRGELAVSAALRLVAVVHAVGYGKLPHDIGGVARASAESTIPPLTETDAIKGVPFVGASATPVFTLQKFPTK